jgi:hypothetical protein
MSENNINLGIEQIAAAIIAKFGKVNISMESLLSDYSAKSISVTQDLETQDLVLELIDKPTEAE